MPIKNLTDRTSLSFAEIGRIRLGIPKSEMTRGPKELPFFRVEFRKDEPDSAATFRSIFGDTPTRIDIRLPFTDISQVWDANYEVYNKTGLLGMADGERWMYLRSQSGEILVRDGQPFMPFDKNTPVYSYPSNKGQDVGVYAKPTGRLKVVVPQLHRVAYLVMVTHSFYNILNITQELAGIKAMLGNIAMVPLVLTRRAEQISVSIDGKKSMMEKYLVHIEVDSKYFVNQGTFEIAAPAQQLALPEPKDLEENEPDEYTEEPVTTPEPVSAPEPDSAPEPEPEPEPEHLWTDPVVSEITRPYDADQVKAHLLSLAAENESDQKIPQKAIGAMVANLNYCMPDPKDGNRHAFINWVFGIKSCNDLTWGQGKALKTWMNVAQVDNNWLPAAVAMVEAKNVIDWLNKNQPKLFD